MTANADDADDADAADANAIVELVIRFRARSRARAAAAAPQGINRERDRKRGSERANPPLKIRKTKLLFFLVLRESSLFDLGGSEVEKRKTKKLIQFTPFRSTLLRSFFRDARATTRESSWRRAR